MCGGCGATASPASPTQPVAQTQSADDDDPHRRQSGPAEASTYDGPPKRILVELFSSQGCNSCPAADALVGALPSLGFGRDRVVALTYHVTYWDDLGWKDPYANALFDQRQIGYAQRVAAARAQDEGTLAGPSPRR